MTYTRRRADCGRADKRAGGASAGGRGVLCVEDEAGRAQPARLDRRAQEGRQDRPSAPARLIFGGSSACGLGFSSFFSSCAINPGVVISPSASPAKTIPLVNIMFFMRNATGRKPQSAAEAKCFFGGLKPRFKGRILSPCPASTHNGANRRCRPSCERGTPRRLSIFCSKSGNISAFTAANFAPLTAAGSRCCILVS